MSDTVAYLPEADRSSHGSSHGFRLGDALRGERAALGRSLLDAQRDLRIKAAYIVAIENCDPSAFPSSSFVPGHVRAYARYLGLDPDEVYRIFCEESGFTGVHQGERSAVPLPGKVGARRAAPAGSFRPDFPLAAASARRLPEIPFAAIGSLLVLLGLIGALGYGGWTLLQNIQRVQFAPVEDVPLALAEVAPLAAPEPVQGPVLPDYAAPVAATALAELYRQQELEVPILVPRDGPIAAIDPEQSGLLARGRTLARPETAAVAALAGPPPGAGAGAGAAGAEAEAAAERGETEPGAAPTAEDARPRITVIAERPAWIRVYTSNGTVIFERILESGDVYEVPETAEPPMIWAGNSGSVYLRMGDTLHGPIGRGTRAARDVPLDPAAVSERFAVVADIPSVIADTIGAVQPPDAGLSLAPAGG